jgi:hypothetical protein
MSIWNETPDYKSLTPLQHIEFIKDKLRGHKRAALHKFPHTKKCTLLDYWISQDGESAKFTLEDQYHHIVVKFFVGYEPEATLCNKTSVDWTVDKKHKDLGLFTTYGD